MTLAKVALPAVLLVILLSVLATRWLTRRVERRFPSTGKFATVDRVRLHYIDLPADSPDLAPMRAICMAPLPGRLPEGRA